MPTTDNGIVYPAGDDDVAALASVFAALASSVDTALNGYVKTDAFATANEIEEGIVTDKMISPKALADAGVIAGDTGWVNITNDVTAAPGFVKHPGFVAWARRVGDLIQLYITNLRKASGSPVVTVNVSGNIANTNVLTGIPAQFRPFTTSALTSGAGGRSNSFVVNNSGTVQLVATVPDSTQTGNRNHPTNEEYSFGGVYFA